MSALPYFLADDFSYFVDYDFANRELRVINSRDGNLIATLPKQAVNLPEGGDDRKREREIFSCVHISRERKAKSEFVETYNRKTGILTEWPVKRITEKENICCVPCTRKDAATYITVDKD